MLPMYLLLPMFSLLSPSTSRSKNGLSPLYVSLDTKLTQLLGLLVEPAGILPGNGDRSEILFQWESGVFPSVAAHAEYGVRILRADGIAYQSQSYAGDLHPPISAPSPQRSTCNNSPR